jgi:hypothetical protein
MNKLVLFIAVTLTTIYWRMRPCWIFPDNLWKSDISMEQFDASVAEERNFSFPVPYLRKIII